MNTLDQEMASSVFKKISEREHSTDVKKYGAMAHKLPILVRTAGLAEALAFVESRNKEPERVLLDDLADVVCTTTRDDYMCRIRKAELQEYIFLTRKTMLALKWFKRFAQSILKIEATEEEGGER